MAAMAKFVISDTGLQGLRLVQRQRLEDPRGFFSRFFCAEELAEAGFDRPIAQINHTLTRRRGSVRGLHFQHPPHAEDKLVSCLHGEVFDVAVDLRCGSPTFLRWHGEVLSARNAVSLLIPRGFAHGFQALDDDAELLYLHSARYVAAAADALNLRDPALAIDWPLAFADVSRRDADHPFIAAGFTGLSA
jgi:dTDP-4-dehydrorhamnose 3,5-epimerase